jgi:hypothetical protein
VFSYFRGLYFVKAQQTLNEFYTKSVEEHKNKTFIVYENERYSFGETYEMALNLGNVHFCTQSAYTNQVRI